MSVAKRMKVVSFGELIQVESAPRTSIDVYHAEARRWYRLPWNMSNLTLRALRESLAQRMVIQPERIRFFTQDQRILLLSTRVEDIIHSEDKRNTLSG